MNLLQQFKETLKKRDTKSLKRNLKLNSNTVDFTSNDYLGLARNTDLIARIHSLSNNMKLLGSTGSRLLTGHSMHVNQLEIYLAKFHKSQDGIIFNSGFDANYGLFSCIANVNDCFLVDELIHSSVHEGIKGSRCKYWKSFKHNDTIDLKIKIDQFRFISNGHIFIAIESIYSMDGCLSKLKEITDLLDTYTDVHLIIDEAHSTGICGPNGSGLVCELELQDKVLARVHTFGKAIGCHGAIILGSTILKEYLINYAKPLIFSTFLPLHTLISIRLSYEYMIDHYEELYPMLKSRIVLFRKLLQPYRDIPLLDSNSPIQGIIIPGNKNVCEAAEQLQHDGLDVRPIRSPTVPKGRERLRICLHLHNTDDDIRKLVYFISQLSIFKSNDIYSKL